MLKRFLDRSQARYGRPLQAANRDAAFNAWNLIRKEIVGRKRQLVSTLGNATSKLFSDSAMRDSKYVVLILDEQALDTDASLINTLVGFINEERVKNEFGNTTPVVSVIPIGNRRQNSPLIKSNEARTNTFGPAACQFALCPILRVRVQDRRRNRTTLYGARPLRITEYSLLCGRLQSSHRAHKRHLS